MDSGAKIQFFVETSVFWPIFVLLAGNFFHGDDAAGLVCAWMCRQLTIPCTG